jgi:hypothetical protein
MPALPNPARRARQLPLFPPSRHEPSWESLPAEIRQQIEQLLARMLRGHAARSLGTAPVGDDHE